ncbi:hypothetical protein [Pseudoalteromonas denitrificans]|uniref:Uncharacterized protein n=1 Tax=Pseudoalteromonas denitrificans DSM 6059 TaxID=1123010 RepID=A0A1I1T4Y0_9GAMM|nr:hypothetical protein [Pseudoalteromonas denitrificans]SFD53681.1 hypothetical protein SAMN02745724_04788 [Pseudoalteromonas denitrificans DSM 6059]
MGAGNLGFATGFSLTLAFDTKLNGTYIYTPELGFGSEGASGFVRGVFGFDANNTVSDLHGEGQSFSVGIGKLSFSAANPGRLNNFGNISPIVEIGKNFGGSGFSLTDGNGMTPEKFAVFINKLNKDVKTNSSFILDYLQENYGSKCK